VGMCAGGDVRGWGCVGVCVCVLRCVCGGGV